MDMLPPQAPPAQTQTVYHEAERSFDRLVALQAWLAAEHATLPTISDTFSSDRFARFVTDLDAWWDAAPASGEGASRRAALAARIASAANDLAILAHQDGTLDDDARQLIRAMTSTPGTVPPGMSVREPVMGDTPYAGVLLLQDTAAGDRVLAFSNTRG